MVEFSKPFPDDREDDDTASAEWLIEEGSAIPRPAVPGVPLSGTDESYSLEGGDHVEDEPSIPTPIAAPKPPKRCPADGQAKPQPRPSPVAEVRVDQVWSRWAEWGQDLRRVGLVAVGLAFIFLLAVAGSLFTLAGLVFLAGSAVLVVLNYPILITLERPVRVTPEQAVKDYFAALSHWRPHYLRMWLLLSSAGRTSGPFSSYPAFKAHWEETLASWTGEGAGRFSPWVFTVEEFRSEKSAGQTALDVEFTVNVHERAKANSKPVKSFRMTVGMVRGPDRMWYLNQGSLPENRSSSVAVPGGSTGKDRAL